MANYEATRYDFSGQDLTGVEGVNTGIIIPWGNVTPPSGFLECNGDAVNRTTYANLFAVIGTTYGIGDGTTTFNIPDLTDRVAVGKSPTKSLATSGGANTVTSQGNLALSAGNTTITVPTLGPHSHASNVSMSPQTFAGNTQQVCGAVNPMGMGQGSANDNTPAPFTWSSIGGGGAHNHPFSGGTFTGNATSVLQPFLTLIYIIKI